LLEGAPAPAIQGEVLCCAYMLDSSFLITGGWDGHLRLWEATLGTHVSCFRTGDKPVSSCLVSRDGTQLVSGGLDGLLALWDTVAHRRISVFLAHPRPLSGIAFSRDGQCVATASWDNTAAWWTGIRKQEGKILSGHKDIVAGCRLLPNGNTLLTWSHDKTLRLWDVTRAASIKDMRGHTDRVLCGDVSPDGRWAISGARDNNLRLWDLETGRSVASVNVDDEVMACLFLPDGETVLAIDRFGRVTTHIAPGLGQTGDLATKLPVLSAALAPSGKQFAVTCADGQVARIAIDGLDKVPLVVSAEPRAERRSVGLQKLVGGRKVVVTYHCTCPACSARLDLGSGDVVGKVKKCRKCQRQLKIGCVAQLPV
jgi:WD40 repeat protein